MSHPHPARVPVVVIGGSAGALGALLTIVQNLPPDFPAAVAVVIHIPAHRPSSLPEILGRVTPLAVTAAHNGEPLRPGHVYCAPSDHHLLLRGDALSLTRGPRENRFRPSVDVLFRSAAFTHGSRAVGVLLSGMLDDGSSGLWAIRHLGGTTIVQHPEEAEYKEMPLSALRQVDIDDILPARAIASRLVAWAGSVGSSEVSTAMGETDRERLGREVGIAAEDNAFQSSVLDFGPLSPFTCPECHGVMVSIREGDIERFRCHTGHAYSADALLAQLRHSTEEAMWTAVRALDEQIMLLEHLAKHLDEAGRPEEAAASREEHRDTIERMRTLRLLTLNRTGQPALAEATEAPADAGE